MNVLAFYSSDLIKSSGMTDFTPRIESYNLGKWIYRNDMTEGG